MDQSGIRLLDRTAELHINEGHRPHWLQDGAITFITIRLADSLPKEVLVRWDRERLEFMHRLGIEYADWRDGVAICSVPMFCPDLKRLASEQATTKTDCPAVQTADAE